MSTGWARCQGSIPGTTPDFSKQWKVAEHRLNEEEAIEVMHDLVVTNPRRAFKL